MCILLCCSAVDVEQFQLVADRIQNGMDKINGRVRFTPLSFKLGDEIASV